MATDAKKTRPRKPRREPAPPPPDPGPSRADLIAAALLRRAHARATEQGRIAGGEGPFDPDWCARKAEWLARHVDPFFSPEQIAAAELRHYSDARFAKLTRPGSLARGARVGRDGGAA